MTVRELIKLLLDYPMSAIVYVGKGMGPVTETAMEVSDQIYVVIKP